MSNPGSGEAINKGCTCPIMDNCGGKEDHPVIISRVKAGMGDGFWRSSDCPLHGRKIVREDE